MFKRSVNFSPYEKDQLLQLIREYIVIFEDKRLDGAGRREKERAWLELTDRYNSLENVNLRTSKQLQACWKNLKNRARDITEACKKGAEFPFFTLSNKFNSSYLPSTDDDEAYEIHVKSERLSDREEEERDIQSASLLSQVYSINHSGSPSPPSPGDSPPAVTNYVYSPTSSLPLSFVPAPSSLPSASSISSSSTSASTPTSKTVSHETVSDTPSRVDTIAARLSCSIPTYRTPERSINKSVERIANSILFERGICEDLTTQRFFEGSRSDANAKEGNSVTVDLQKSHEGETGKGTYRSETLNQSHYKSGSRSCELEQIGQKKYGNGGRLETCRAMTSKFPPRVGMNGHASSQPIGRVSKTARFKRIEHQAKMKNLKFERDCMETEHKLRCELLQMKIKYYKKKLAGEV